MGTLIGDRLKHWIQLDLSYAATQAFLHLIGK